jgi:cytidine deaminase
LTESEFIEVARAARNFSVSPYSGFLVGAALETVNGSIFTGCNIECSSYGLTVCAERVAVWKAMSDGEKHFKRIAIVADTKRLTPPCGACRQVLWDFCRDAVVLLANTEGHKRKFQMRELYAHAFDERFLLEPHRK